MKTALLTIALAVSPSFAAAAPNESAPGNASPGEAFIRSFFANWINGRFEEMGGQVTPRGAEQARIFAESLAATPLHWRNFQAISETTYGDGWDVAFELDVTDFPSAFAGSILNIKMHPPGTPGAFAYLYTPEEFGVETFTTVRQIWHVANAKPSPYISYAIDTGAMKGRENVLNYFIVASDMRNLDGELVSSAGKEDQSSVIDAWFARTTTCLGLDLNRPEENAVWDKVARLVKEGDPKILALPYKPPPRRLGQ